MIFPLIDSKEVCPGKVASGKYKWRMSFSFYVKNTISPCQFISIHALSHSSWEWSPLGNCLINEAIPFTGGVRNVRRPIWGIFSQWPRDWKLSKVINQIFGILKVNQRILIMINVFYGGWDS